MYRLSNIPFNFDKSINDLIFKNNSTAKFESHSFIFKKNDFLILDTYFSSFSVGKWKNNTDIKNLSLNIEFHGDILVKIRHIEPGENIQDFTQKHLHAKPEDGFISQSINIDNFSQLNGIFTIEIFANSDSVIKDIYWGTVQPPKYNVQLAIVITTFNRQEAVSQSVEKITSQLSKDLDYHIFVIDNGSNLNLDYLHAQNLTVIPSQNFGGAGGFSRGLDEVFKAGKFTHCLFMDDDASCLMESIERAYHFLQYATSDKLSIAGAMLYASNPTWQHESGAQFNGYCIPLKHNLDLTQLGVLVENERYEKIDYAGWWFFMFPLKYVNQYAYPFFVRGDDSNFSIQQDFDIQTLNGVGSWQESFACKSSPMTEYLDMRYHLAHKFHIDYLPDDAEDVLRTFWKFIRRNNNKYLYESAEACCLAFEDFMKGPAYFENDIDATEARKQVANLRELEFLAPVERGISKQEFEAHFSGRFWTYARKLTLNGHLIPDFMLDRSERFVDKRYSMERNFFLANRVTYVDPENNTSFTIPQSKRKYFKNLAKATKLSAEYLLKHKKIKKQYQDNYERMCSPDAWKKRFGQ